ncbi:MAG TPA: tyrosine-type recombinase/integrase [Thermoleophilia bacterium]|nr:tyrosine-type recombinase/integrase [Thermoleophilia bacterium]
MFGKRGLGYLLALTVLPAAGFGALFAIAPSTRARDDSYFRSFILPYFADESLAKVNPLHVQGWVSALLAKDYAPATIRKAYQLLSAVFDAAVTSDLIARSPCRGIKLPKDVREEMRFLSPDEMEKLANAIDPRYQTLVLTGAYTGLRPGELLGLKLNQLDMLRRQLRVVGALSEVKGQVRLGPPKSKASRRTVAMPDFLVEELARHLAQYGDPDGWAFSSPQGGPVRRTNFRRWFWLPAVQTSVGDPLRFHELRHSHAALLIAEGVHPKVLQDRLGHASITTTLDTYGHLMKGLDEAAADALDASRRESPAGSTLRA